MPLSPQYDEAKAELTELKEKCERAEQEKQSLADKFEECRATMEELKEKGTKVSAHHTLTNTYIYIYTFLYIYIY